MERKTDRDNYIPFRNREVVRAFEADKIADEGVFCIVIEGKEQGRFWLHKEGGENHLAFYHGNGDIID